MHNWWLEILFCYGIGIFVLYILMYLNFIRTLYLNIKTTCDQNSRYYSIMMLAILGGFVIASVGSSSLFATEWLWIFWALLIAYQSGIKTSCKIEDSVHHTCGRLNNGCKKA